MVKESNKRVMITLPKKTLLRLDKLCEIYDMTYSQFIKMVVMEKIQERKID